LLLLDCFILGREYSGYVNVTNIGIPCQRWADQEPQIPELYDDFPDPLFETVSNYCRDPDGSNTPWCYTMSPATRWSYCPVPKCGKKNIVQIRPLTIYNDVVKMVTMDFSIKL